MVSKKEKELTKREKAVEVREQDLAIEWASLQEQKDDLRREAKEDSQKRLKSWHAVKEQAEHWKAKMSELNRREIALLEREKEVVQRENALEQMLLKLRSNIGAEIDRFLVDVPKLPDEGEESK